MAKPMICYSLPISHHGAYFINQYVSQHDLRLRRTPVCYSKLSRVFSFLQLIQLTLQLSLLKNEEIIFALLIDPGGICEL